MVVVGGGVSAVAVALTACARGYRVAIIEATHWLGGQMTSQGVSALDEHKYIETWPGSTSYAALRLAIRQRMAQLYGITPADFSSFNPGNAWVSNLCFFPKVAATVISDLLDPFVSDQLLQVYYRTTVRKYHSTDARVHAVDIIHDGVETTLSAAFFIDASDSGDVLWQTGRAFISGAESYADTGEASAPQVARPSEVQSFTYGLIVEYCPGENHRIAKPEGYESLRDRQPFSLTLTGNDGQARPFRMFNEGPTGLPSFWTYRRLWDGTHTTPHTNDIALINWNSNDYHHASIIGVSQADIITVHDEAKRLSLAFLYWLQTEVPRDDGGYGYPELRLRPDLMGSNDGLSLVPYVRESRRSSGLQRIIAEDILVETQQYARARHWPDSVGVGWYFMDLHPAPGNMTSMFAPTRPFQIPMGALIPPDCENLLLANKTIATTHLSNGAYRLHPIEWQIGTAVAHIAILSLNRQVSPADIHANSAHIEAVQAEILQDGQALAWAIDIPPSHPAYRTTQWLLVWGVIADGDRAHQLHINPDLPLSERETMRLQHILGLRKIPLELQPQMTWFAVCSALESYMP